MQKLKRYALLPGFALMALLAMAGTAFATDPTPDPAIGSTVGTLTDTVRVNAMDAIPTILVAVGVIFATLFVIGLGLRLLKKARSA